MIYVIGGTTASGKSDLAFAFAQETNAIIINGDAFAVYHELNIGTAKPNSEQLSTIDNFLFNHCSISEQFSIYDYQQAVRTIINKYKGERPLVIVGGSGLYIRSVLYDYRFSEEVPRVDEAKYLEFSNIALHNKLKEIDSVSAKHIHPNNRKRVLRALAIAENTPLNKSENEAKQQKGPLFNNVVVCLDKPKELLNKRIYERTTAMFAKGLRAEVQTLMATYAHNLQALQAIGYKEIINNFTENDDFLIDLIAKNTIKYAKRQRTFFKHQFKSVWFNEQQAALAYLLMKHEEVQNAKNKTH